jgi:hypothetical protein
MVTLIFIYLGLGVLFSLAFAAIGCRVIDPGAANSGFFMRLMWMPAAIVLWPILLQKWIKTQ